MLSCYLAYQALQPNLDILPHDFWPNHDILTNPDIQNNNYMGPNHDNQPYHDALLYYIQPFYDIQQYHDILPVPVDYVQSYFNTIQVIFTDWKKIRFGNLKNLIFVLLTLCGHNIKIIS